MPIKFVQQCLEARFEVEDAAIVFSVPSNGEKLARSLDYAKRFEHATYESDGKTLVSLDKLSPEEMVTFSDWDIDYLSGQALRLDGFVDADDNPIDSSSWSQQQWKKFLLWIDSTQESFDPWVSKYVSPQKKT